MVSCFNVCLPALHDVISGGLCAQSARSPIAFARLHRVCTQHRVQTRQPPSHRVCSGQPREMLHGGTTVNAARMLRCCWGAARRR
jgi:hypothetical protein